MSVSSDDITNTQGSSTVSGVGLATRAPLLNTPSLACSHPDSHTIQPRMDSPGVHHAVQNVGLKSRANRMQAAATMQRSSSPVQEHVRKRLHNNDSEGAQTNSAVSSRLGAPLKRNKIAVSNNAVTTFRKHIEVQAPKRHNENL